MSTEPEIAKAVASVASDGGPFAIKNLVPTLWMIGVGALSGIVSFYQKVKEGKARALNITELVGEMLVSAFVGLITFWICRNFGVNEYLTAAGVAISGHMGARAIFIMEQWIEKKGNDLVR